MSFINFHRTVTAVSGGVLLLMFFWSLKTRDALPLTLFAVSCCWIVFLLFFLRNPSRIVSVDAGKIIAPCDGTIVEISSSSPGYIRVQVFLSIFDVHIFR